MAAAVVFCGIGKAFYPQRRSHGSGSTKTKIQQNTKTVSIFMGTCLIRVPLKMNRSKNFTQKGHETLSSFEQCFYLAA